MQSLYSAIPYALSPVLGNPLAMAAVNVDRTASLPTQVHLPVPACPMYLHPQYSDISAEYPQQLSDHMLLPCTHGKPLQKLLC